MHTDTLQRIVGEWAQQAFPQSTPWTVMNHLTREINELGQVVKAEGIFSGAEAEEMADCFLLLLHLAYKRGVSLHDAALAKFAINQQRQWGQPDAEGVVEHIRES